jgi:hypothetical protein
VLEADASCTARFEAMLYANHADTPIGSDDHVCRCRDGGAEARASSASSAGALRFTAVAGACAGQCYALVAARTTDLHQLKRVWNIGNWLVDVMHTSCTMALTAGRAMHTVQCFLPPGVPNSAVAH